MTEIADVMRRITVFLPEIILSFTGKLCFFLSASGYLLHEKRVFSVLALYSQVGSSPLLPRKVLTLSFFRLLFFVLGAPFFLVQLSRFRYLAVSEPVVENRFDFSDRPFLWSEISNSQASENAKCQKDKVAILFMT